MSRIYFSFNFSISKIFQILFFNPKLKNGYDGGRSSYFAEDAKFSKIYELKLSLKRWRFIQKGERIEIWNGLTDIEQNY